MDASNRLDFGLNSATSVNDFHYAGNGMDCGLHDFPIQFPGRSGTSTVEGNIRYICTTTAVFPWPLSYDGPLLRPRPPPSTHINFKELKRQRDSREQRSTAMLWTNVCKEIENLLKVILSKVMPAKAQKLRKSLNFSRKSGRHSKSYIRNTFPG